MAAEKNSEQEGVARALSSGRRAKWWKRRGSKERGFWYEDHLKKRISIEADLERIRSLVIPPAWSHVRISPHASSAIQALGVDTSGRIQYLYHPAFSERRQRQKFRKVEQFGERLPMLRKTTNEHIALDGFSKERVLAIIVRLINDLYFRVGSETSVKRYRTYGVTTLRNRHLEIKPRGILEFKFTGKHHIKHRRLIVDEELAALLKDMKAFGGAKLFNYIGEDGKPHPITPRDVNEYIRSSMNGPFTAKDFRTWGGTLLAATELAEIGIANTQREMKQKLVAAMRKVSERLGNTPAICRSSYVHPIVIKRYTEGITIAEFRKKVERYIRKTQPEYEIEELALLRMLRGD